MKGEFSGRWAEAGETPARTRALPTSDLRAPTAGRAAA